MNCSPLLLHHVVLVEDSRSAEVDDLEEGVGFVGGVHQVFGLQVSVDYAFGMAIVQSSKDVLHYGQTFHFIQIPFHYNPPKDVSSRAQFSHNVKVLFEFKTLEN